MAIVLSDATKEQIKNLMAQYPDAQSAIVPALHLVQKEYGWLPQEALEQVAAVLGLTATQVGSVASFYTMFHLKQVGRHVIEFCTDLPCALVGAEQVYQRLREKLGLKDGEETTADGAITLRETMCLGGCNCAPVLLLDNEMQHEHMMDAQLDQLIAHLKANVEP